LKLAFGHRITAWLKIWALKKILGWFKGTTLSAGAFGARSVDKAVELSICFCCDGGWVMVFTENVRILKINQYSVVSL
jgi:hypothetical protein